MNPHIDARKRFLALVAPLLFLACMDWALPAHPQGASVVPQVHFQRYPGATADRQLRAAQAASAGGGSTVVFVMDAPGTFAAPVTLSRGASLLFRANAALSANTARIELTGDNRVSCVPGVSLTGTGKGMGHGSFLFASGGANYDLLAGCSLHDMERGVLMPARVQNVNIHDVKEAWNLYSLAFIGHDVSATSGPDASQPSGIRFDGNLVHDSVLGLDLYYAHHVEAHGNRFQNLALYGLTGAGGDAAHYAVPNGSMTDLDYHNNTCDHVQACEFVAVAQNVHLGHGSICAHSSDYCFGAEGSQQVLIDDAVCGDGVLACAATEFRADHATFSNITSLSQSSGGILVKNSGGNADFVADVKVLQSHVHGMLIESVSRLEVAGNVSTDSIHLVGFHNGVSLHDNTVTHTYGKGDGAACVICVGSSSGALPDQYERNHLVSTGAVPAGAQSFRILEANFNAALHATVAQNWSVGAPVFLRFDSTGGNAGIHPEVQLHGNRRENTTLQNVNTNGRGFIQDDNANGAGAR